MIGISQFVGEGNPYPDAEYVEIANIVGKNIVIKGVTPFENTKGPGVHILMEMDGKDFRACTHSGPVTELLTRDSIQAALVEDEIECRFVMNRSKAGREYLGLEDPQ